MKNSNYCLDIEQARRELEESIPSHLKKLGRWRPKTSTAPRPEIKRLKLSELIIDRVYQRTLSASQLLSYGDFSLALLNPLTVVIRPDGTKSSLDGQHSSVFTYCAFNDKDFEVDCRVFDMSESTLEECLKFEAKLYKTLNKNRKSTGEFESLKAGLVLEEPESLEFSNYLKLMGIRAESMGSRSKKSRNFRPQRITSTNSIGDNAPKIGQFIKCYRRYIKDFKEEMSTAIGIVKDQTKGDIEDRMILVLTGLIVFLQYGELKGRGKISNSLNHLIYDHFLEWLQINLNNLTWVKSGDDLGHRCVHIIMKTYEDYVKSLPAGLSPERTLTKSDLDYNGFFHPDEKPSKKAWKELYEKGEVIGDKTNTLKNFK